MKEITFRRDNERAGVFKHIHVIAAPGHDLTMADMANINSYHEQEQHLYRKSDIDMQELQD